MGAGSVRDHADGLDRGNVVDSPLIYFGLHRVEERPKLLRFTGAWWTLVFPLGMYSVATNMIAGEIHLRSLQTVALVIFWDAFLAWAIVAIAGLLRIPRALTKVQH